MFARRNGPVRFCESIQDFNVNFKVAVNNSQDYEIAGHAARLSENYLNLLRSTMYLLVCPRVSLLIHSI